MEYWRRFVPLLSAIEDFGQQGGQSFLLARVESTCQRCREIEIGSVAGPSAEIASAALRAVRLQIVGSGQGSVPTRDFLAELPALVTEITSGALSIGARPVPLTDVATAWNDKDAEQRVVITAGGR
jgi:hypothetical protein